MGNKNYENYKKAVETIRFCSDLQIKRDEKITELGMMMNKEVSFNHVIEADIITLNIKDIPILTITPESPILEAFIDLIDCMNEV